MTFPYSFYIPVIGLSFMVSILLYFGRNIGYLKYFPPFLLLSLLVEFFGMRLAKTNTNNALVYNAFLIVEIPFFLFILRTIIKNSRARIIIGYNIAFYVFIKIINFLLLPAAVHHMVSYTVGGICIVGYCCYYFYRQYKQPDRPHLLLNPDMWICFGLAFFYILLVPVYVSFIFERNFSRSYVVLSSLVLSWLNVVMYTSFIIAFLCKLKLSKTNHA